MEKMCNALFMILLILVAIGITLFIIAGFKEVFDIEIDFENLKNINWFYRKRYFIRGRVYGHNFGYYSIDGDWTDDISKAFVFKNKKKAKEVRDLLDVETATSYYILETTAYALKEIKMRKAKEDLSEVEK